MPDNIVGMPQSQNKSRMFRLILVGFSMIIGFTFTEAFVRLTRVHHDIMQYTGRKERPMAMGKWSFVDAFSAYRSKPNRRYEADTSTPAAQWKTSNEHGHTSTPSISTNKADGVTRIVFLGGSSTAGDAKGLADELTWPWRTVEKLNQRAGTIKYDFINAAAGGYSTFESFGRLTARLRFFQPDIVVLYQGWNDMYYYREPDRLTRWRMLEDDSWTFDRPAKRPPMIEPKWYDHLIARSQLFSHVRVKLSNPDFGEVAGEVFADLHPNYDSRGPATYRQNIRLLRDACASLGIEFYACKQATLVVDGLSESEQERCGYALHGLDHEAHVRAFAEQYRIIDEEIDADHRIDLSNFSGKPELFFDHIHLRPVGTDLLAEKIAGHLEAHALK